MAVSGVVLNRPILLLLSIFCFLLVLPSVALAQGGPPFYTTDPGTPGNLNWEINFGYMPFLYNGNSITHTPDVDINFGVGDRIQLTYENAWLRVWNQGAPAKYGMGQDNVGVKWRFYDSGEDGMQFSIFPQGFINNPNHAAQRGITPPGSSFLFPVEFTKKIGPIDLNLETGYNVVHLGPNGWFTGMVLGHEFTKKLELDTELFTTGTFHPAFAQPVFDVGGRYKVHRPFIFLWMAGRSVEPGASNQPYFVGYFGVQVLLPLKSYDRDEESSGTSGEP
jgi:hypothetical protein